MVYDLPTVEMQPDPIVGYQAPDVKNFAPAQMQEQGAAFSKAGAVTSRIADDIQDQIDTATTKEMDNRLADAIRTTLYDPEKGYLLTEGKTALESQQGALKALNESVTQIQTGLTTDIQRIMFHDKAVQRLQAAKGLIAGHAAQQTKAYNFKETEARLNGALQDAVQHSAGWRDEGSLYYTYKKTVLAEADSLAAQSGIARGSAQYEALRMEKMTALHANVVYKMIGMDRAKDAEEYFNAQVEKGEIRQDRREEIRKHVKGAVTATEADDLAARVWTELGPRGLNDAVKIYDLTQRIRELAGDNEEVQNKAIAGIKDRAAEWNGQQTEVKAQYISGVWGMVDRGKSFKEIQLSPEWLGLSETDQHAIRERMEIEAATKANRAAAQSAKELSDLQRQEHLALLKNGDEYLTATNPNVLRQMSRAQVEATRTKFGLQATQHLLTMWDSIQNPTKYQEAKLDADTFNAVVRSFGLDPGSKSQDVRNRVGALKFRLEEAINSEMNRRKAPMTATEKTEFIKKTISEQVLIEGGWLGYKKVPAVNLTNEEIAKLYIPEKDRKKLVTAMADRYKATKDPSYAPTNANLKRFYLQHKIPGYTDFVPPETEF